MAATTQATRKEKEPVLVGASEEMDLLEELLGMASETPLTGLYHY